MTRRRSGVAALALLALACTRSGASEQDLERTRAALGLPPELPCTIEGSSGGGRQREGLRLEVSCEPSFTPGAGWAPGPLPAVVEQLRRPPRLPPDVTHHHCRVSTLARPNTNDFVDHRCTDPLPDGVVHYRVAVRRADGSLRSVSQAYY